MNSTKLTHGRHGNEMSWITGYHVLYATWIEALQHMGLTWSKLFERWSS